MKEIDELQRAISALEAQRAVLGDAIVDPALISMREKLAALEARQPASRQRRLVTVLFLDIVDSTTISQGLEPEEVQEVIGGALKRLSLPVEAHGGQVTEFMGDGFVAVFGIPRVQENDARQAVRAGLAILGEAHAVGNELERNANIRGFAVRIGIHTGRVVPGEFKEAESPVMGLTVSLAARIEQAAQPGTVYISHFTHQHVRGAFEVESLPPISAKGFTQPVAVYRVRSARPRTFRTFTRGVEGIKTSLIGRDAELHQINEAFNRAIQNQETQLITVLGEAGVGKSRLLYEFDRHAAQGSSHVIAFKARASPQTTAVPFGMLRQMVAYRLGVLTTDPAEATRQRLVDSLGSFFAEDALMKAHFVGSLLGFDFPDSPYLKGMEKDPEKLRERGQAYLTEYFSATAARTATMIMLDDIHWSDALTVNFIAHLVQQCPALPLLVICLGRPTLMERFPGWGKQVPAEGTPGKEAQLQSNSTLLTLGTLSREASQELLDEILSNVEELPQAVSERILDIADGNPFYLEEYIQALVDVKAIQKGSQAGTWTLDQQRLDRLELPSTLVALLEARLDSLTAAQRTLVQQAAVIGRLFWRSTLQAIRAGKTVSDSELETLSRRGFFHLQEASTFAGTEEYRFHHGLLRDAAYQTLRKSDRQEYHGKAASWLILTTEASGRTGEFAPVIAEHYEAAAEKVLAAQWYMQAGGRARKQGAPGQALTFYDRALSLLPAELPLSIDDELQALHWQALIGRDDMLSILGNTEARMANDLELVALANSIGDDQLLAEAYYRQGYFLGVRGQFQKERQAYLQGLQAARRAGDRRHEALLLALKSVSEVRLNTLDAAERTAAEALRCAQEVGDDEILARTLTNVSVLYAETGDMARTVQLLEHQLEISRRMENIEGEMFGLSNLGYSNIMLGMPAQAVIPLQRCIQLARQAGHRSIGAYGCLNLALAYLLLEDIPAALHELDCCLPELQEMKDVFGYGIGQVYAALVLEKAGRIPEALETYRLAAGILKEIGIPVKACDAEAGMARCQLALSEPAKAKSCAMAVWEHLQQDAGSGMEFPLLGFETCASVFSATGEAALARKAIQAGHDELMRRAERISLPEWRRSFLEGLPEHRRLQERWQELMGQDK